MSFMSMRQHSQDSSGVVRAATKEPVFLTNRGKATHVLMSIEHYEKMQGGQKSVVDSLRQDGGPEYDFEFEAPKLGGELFRPVGLE